jgi:DNA-binding NarL/FixJ family response regulator
MNILVLDDHPSIVAFTVIKLQELNNTLTIFKANTVEQALLLLDQNNVDRVICDLQLIKGKNMVIPEYCCRKQIPYMVFSTHVNYTLIKELKEFKVTSYVSKGAETEYLIEGLSTLLKNRSYFCPEVKKEELNKNGTDIPRPKLSKSEYKVVKAFSLGMRTDEVAKHLCLEKVTIRNHRARASDKNLCSFHELVERFNYWEGT